MIVRLLQLSVFPSEVSFRKVRQAASSTILAENQKRLRADACVADPQETGPLD